MTVLFIDGFDHQNDSTDLASGDDWSAANVSISASYARFAGKGVQLGSGTALGKTLTAPLASGVIGFALNQNATNGDHDLTVSILDSASGLQFQAIFGYAARGDFGIFDGNGTLLGSLPGGSLGVGVWYYVELVFTIGNPGSFVLLVNSLSRLTLTVNTQTTGNADWQTANLTPTLSTIWLDDFYILDPSTGIAPWNAPLSDNVGVYVDTLFPAANVTPIDFAPSPGSNANWQNVSETAMDGDTTYNFSALIGDQDMYAVGPMTATPNEIYAVAIRAAARLDTGTLNLRNVVSSSGTVENGATVALGSSYAYQTDILETDPNTTGIWTEAAVNALLIGYQAE
jgi:hypothetical protein